MEQHNLHTIVVDKPIQFIRILLGDKKAGDLFLKIADYLLKQDNKLIVRTDCSTIGLSRPGERYLFYVATGQKTLCCKFKHWEKVELFPQPDKRYKGCCDDVLRLYAENPESFKIGASVPPAHTPEKDVPVAAPKSVSSTQTPQIVTSPAESQTRKQSAPEKSCSNCFLRVGEQCTSWENTLCEDYRPAVVIPPEEMADWPKYGDASVSKEDYWRRSHGYST